MPGRPRTTLAAALAALGGLVAGCGSTTSSDSASGTPSTAATATAAATTPAAGASSTGPASATESPGAATASAPPSTSPAASATTPTAARAWVPDPWNKGYEFGFIWGAKRSGDAVVLTFDRAGMLLGKQAKAYYDAHPDEERFDYKILNDKSFTETVRVPPSASLYGNQMLGPRKGSQNERITPGRLLARASGDARHPVAVWLTRTGSGPVVYLAEQYLP
jgi:hypothetical protein